jgi:hypothetical protein
MLDGLMASVMFAHLVFILPYMFLSLADPYRRFDRRMLHVAAGLGMGFWRRLFQVRLPIMIGPVLTALAIGIAVSIGQYLPTLLIGAGRVPTLTTEAVALSAGGDRRALAVAASLQALLPFLRSGWRWPCRPFLRAGAGACKSDEDENARPTDALRLEACDHHAGWSHADRDFSAALRPARC